MPKPQIYNWSNGNVEIPARLPANSIFSNVPYMGPGERKG